MPAEDPVPERGLYVKDFFCECGRRLLDEEVVEDGHRAECDGDDGCGAVYELEWIGMEASVTGRDA